MARTPAGSSSSPTFGGGARAGRELPPDRQRAHRAAGRLPRDRDPDTIRDPAVREAYLEQLHAELEDDDRAGGGRRTGGALSPSDYAAKLGVGDELAGAILGMIATAVVINYLRDGWPGVRAWAAAKFLNRTTTYKPAAAGAASSTSASSSPATGAVVDPGLASLLGNAIPKAAS